MICSGLPERSVPHRHVPGLRTIGTVLWLYAQVHAVFLGGVFQIVSSYPMDSMRTGLERGGTVISHAQRRCGSLYRPDRAF